MKYLISYRVTGDSEDIMRHFKSCNTDEELYIIMLELIVLARKLKSDDNLIVEEFKVTVWE